MRRVILSSRVGGSECGGTSGRAGDRRPCVRRPDAGGALREPRAPAAPPLPAPDARSGRRRRPHAGGPGPLHRPLPRAPGRHERRRLPAHDGPERPVEAASRRSRGRRRRHRDVGRGRRPPRERPRALDAAARAAAPRPSLRRDADRSPATCVDASRGRGPLVRGDRIRARDRDRRGRCRSSRVRGSACAPCCAARRSTSSGSRPSAAPCSAPSRTTSTDAPGPETPAIEAHLAECADCRHTLASFQEAGSRLRGVGPFVPLAGMLSRLGVGVARRRRRARPASQGHSPSRSPRLIAVATFGSPTLPGIATHPVRTAAPVIDRTRAGALLRSRGRHVRGSASPLRAARPSAAPAAVARRVREHVPPPARSRVACRHRRRPRAAGAATRPRRLPRPRRRKPRAAPKVVRRRRETPSAKTPGRAAPGRTPA